MCVWGQKLARLLRVGGGGRLTSGSLARARGKIQRQHASLDIYTRIYRESEGVGGAEGGSRVVRAVASAPGGWVEGGSSRRRASERSSYNRETTGRAAERATKGDENFCRAPVMYCPLVPTLKIPRNSLVNGRIVGF